MHTLLVLAFGIVSGAGLSDANRIDFKIANTTREADGLAPLLEGCAGAA